MNRNRKLPAFVQGGIIGALIGGISFLFFVALFSFTPLYFLLAIFGAWGASPVDAFVGIAPSATMLGAWIGGFIGMFAGMLNGVSRRKKGLEDRQFPGYVSGAVLATYFFLPLFLDSSSKIAGYSVTLRIITLLLFVGVGAFVGFLCTMIKRLFHKKDIPSV